MTLPIILSFAALLLLCLLALLQSRWPAWLRGDRVTDSSAETSVEPTAPVVPARG